jgi:hypothetical protein
VFAPGHLGELTQYVPFELVDAVLAETGTVQRRLRELPSRVGVYFLLTMGLFPQLGYLRVWEKMVAGLRGLPLPTPSEKALRLLRRRLGPAPLKLLFDTLAVPLARPTTPGVAYGRWRTVAFDGCSSIKVPDAERNRSWLGRIRSRLGWAGYPTVMLMTLCETGTRGLLGAVFGPADKGETAYAVRLLPRLDASMLLLGDRAFDANELLRQAAATGAQLLIRAKSTRRPPLMATLSDGTTLTEIAGVRLRIIDVHLVACLTDGSRISDRYRLLTTLTDHHRHPADRLVRLYHERWEVESAYFALRRTLLDQHVLRSGEPVGLEQEMWALLALYQVLRQAMVAAAESAAGTDPDRLCFTTALEITRDRLILAQGIIPDPEGGPGALQTALLARLLPPRRPRISARKVKSPISRYHTRSDHHRPLTSTAIAEITLTLPKGLDAADLTSPPRQRTWRQGRRRPSRPTVDDPVVADIDRVLAVLADDPGRPWQGKELARELGFTNLNSFCVRLSQWSHKDLILKIAPATYTLTA